MTERILHTYDSFVKSISKIAKKEIIKIEAEEEKKNPADRATDHAKAYWMMGWTWDEIETVLHDMDFEEGTVKKALQNAQKYAQETLKDGPFSMFKEGQLVKLTGSKQPTTLVAINKANLVVQFLDGQRVKVYPEHIDMAASKKLTKAYDLRVEANELYRSADEEDLVPIEVVQQPEKFEFKMTPEMRTPTNITKFLPEKFIDVPEVSQHVEDLVKAVLSIRKEKEAAEEELKAARELVKENNEIVKKIQKRESEAAKDLASILGVQVDANEVLNNVVFRRFENLLLSLSKEVQVDRIPPNLVDKYAELVRLLHEKVPEVADDIMKAIDAWTEANSQLRETLVTEFGISKPPKKILSQDFWKKIKKIFSGIWSKVKNVTYNLKKETIPEVEKLGDKIEEFINEYNLSKTENDVNSALAAGYGILDAKKNRR